MNTVRLPNSERVVISESKVRDYLLSPHHTIGRYKARFFARLGFTQDKREEFTRLIAEFAAAEATLGPATSFGQKYLISGTLDGPSGSADVVTVWIVPTGDDCAHLVTVYPR